MNSTNQFQSVFEQTFDAVVFGAGYAGFAACRRLTRARRSVLLIDRGGDVLWESGRAMHDTAGHSENQDWIDWLNHLTQRGAHDAGLIDGAPAEVLANQALVAMPGLRVLYYASPVECELESSQLTSVIVATKAGLRRVTGKQFLDATEGGELASLLAGDHASRTPTAKTISLYFQNHQWPDESTRPIACRSLPNSSLTWRKTRWANERCLVIELPGSERRERSAWLPALESAREQLGNTLDHAVLTHGSVTAMPSYSDSHGTGPRSLPSNFACASPAMCQRTFASLASRFELGAAAAEELLTLPQSAPRTHAFGKAIPDVAPRRLIESQVAVAGLGTGGLLAAIAAAREGARVMAFDPLPFAGGIGTGGGIHIYYHGVKGGLQDELDERTRKIMPLFGGIAQVRGFHPDAKKVVADAMLHESGVGVITGSLFGVGAKNGRINTGMISTPTGAVEISANAWIDATGDGDLAAHAGATFVLGRDQDGQLHAYSQSSGRASVDDGVTKMHCINYDAGFVDPTDAEDLTRARLLGIGHYEQPCVVEGDHPTYIAPAIGLRQARQFETDYVLSLADLIEHSRFFDCVGYTGCHYDNHAVDYEFESDEAMFWVWVCRQWRAKTACEVPYRCLLPRQLENVWIACRALGVSIEAHNSMRMQRDMQRIGEVAGIAAAMALGVKGASRAVNMQALQEKLRQSGAIKLPEPTNDGFGAATHAGDFLPAVQVGDAASIRKWALDLTSQKDPRSQLWWLYRAGTAAATFVEPLLDSSNPDTSWYAATIMAMWGDVRAQTRLLRAISDHEYGFDPSVPGDRPETFSMVVPRWMVAVALLRICGDAECLETLFELTGDSDLILNVRTSLAITCRRIIERHDLGRGDCVQILALTQRLLMTKPPLEAASPRRNVTDTKPKASTVPYWTPTVQEDFSWQLHLELAKTRIAAGGEPHARALQLLNDPRITVRRAAMKALVKEELSTAIR